MRPMSICVAGWYLSKFDECYMVLHRVKDKYPVHVVSNRESPYLQTIDLPYTVRENTGLEWGAYNHYLMHIWDGESNVLFMHDDIAFHPFVTSGSDVVPPEKMFDNLAALDGVIDQCYVFSSRAEDVENYSRHGRMVWMSKAFLSKAKELGGFWYDDKNKGHISGFDSEQQKEMGCLSYNAGIIAFHSQAQIIGGKVHQRAYIPSFALAKRGETDLEKIRYGKWLSKSSELSSAATDKLHLGCGENHWDGYTNIDLYSDKADVKADVRELPFRDGSFDWVESHHLIEHLNKTDAKNALSEWRRVLRPGGHMFLSCPDLVACVMGLKDAAENVDLWDAFARAVYGEDNPGLLHKHGYSRDALYAAMVAAGYVDVEVKTVIGYRPTPSLLAIGRKE